MVPLYVGKYPSLLLTPEMNLSTVPQPGCHGTLGCCLGYPGVLQAQDPVGHESVSICHGVDRLSGGTITTNDIVGPGGGALFVAMVIAASSQAPWQCISLIRGRWHAGLAPEFGRRQKSTSSRSPPPLPSAVLLE